MAAFTVPSLSDDELDYGATIQAPQKTLFERRKELHSSEAISTNNATASVKPAVQERSEVKPCTSAQTEKAAQAAAQTAPQATPQAVPQAAAQAVPQAVPQAAGTRILVNKKQKGNPVLKCIRNVPWEYGAIIPDYELGMGTCALYLSVRYHNRFPEYIHSRLKELGKSYNLRILLLQVDTKQQDISHELNQLSRMCILAGCTLILAFSHEEAGRYIEVYKAYENKPPTDIMGKTKSDFLSQATEFLTAVKGVNKTDVTTLLARFKTIKAIITADVESLSLCPGIGPVKARRLHNAFSTPFLKKSKTVSPSKNAQVEELLDELEEDGLL